jgi:glycosyltransferase involved in cell wall biosynthesis
MHRDRKSQTLPAHRGSTSARRKTPGVQRFVHYMFVGLDPPNGVSHAALAWADAQRQAGYEVTVLFDGGESREPRVTESGVELLPIRHVGRWQQTRVPLRLSSFLRAGDVVTLHENFKTRHLLAAAVCRRRQIPYISMPHGSFAPRILAELRQPVAPRSLAERWLLNRAAAVHVFFDSEKDEVAGFQPAVSRYLVAPTGVDMPDRTWSGTGDYLAWIGRYAPDHKGLDVLLSALAAIDEHDRPHLHMRGPDYKGGRHVVESLVQRLGLEDWVTVDGPVYGEEKLDFLCRCRSYIHPSRWESHSIALCENLALGVPTIVSNTIHIAPLLKAYGAALVVDLTPDQLAMAIKHTGAAGSSLSLLSQNARRFVAENLAWSSVIDSYLSQVEAALPRE